MLHVYGFAMKTNSLFRPQFVGHGMVLLLERYCNCV